MAAEFKERTDYHTLAHRMIKEAGRAFYFRIYADAHSCEEEWKLVKPEVMAWASENGIRMRFSGQCAFVPEDQPNFERSVMAFMLRWC